MPSSLDTTTVRILRKMLYGNSESEDRIPEGLIQIHDRMVELMMGLGGRSRIGIEMAACAVMFWQQTTLDGQAFVGGRGLIASNVATPTSKAGEEVDWRTVESNSPVVALVDGQAMDGFFLHEVDVERIKVKIPGTPGHPRNVAKSLVRLVTVERAIAS